MKSILLFVLILATIQVFLSQISLAMIQDQALVASKHFLNETETKNVTDNAEVGRVVCCFIWVLLTLKLLSFEKILNLTLLFI